MSQFDSSKDYYGVLGVDKDASQVEIDRQYKREASKHHPDRGGSEERMKSLNEAYGVLKDKSLRSSYDARQATRTRDAARLCPGNDSNGPKRRSFRSLSERAALSYWWYVFTTPRALSVVLVSLAARDSCGDDSRLRSPAGT